MKLKRFSKGLRLASTIGGSVCLIYVIILGLQPALERVFGGGTLVASVARAEGVEHAPENHLTQGDQVHTEQERPKEIFSEDPIAVLALTLRKKQDALRQREKEIEEDERRLQALRDAIRKQLGELRDLRRRLEAQVADLEVQISDEKAQELRRWVQIYAAMQPLQASQVLAGVDEDLAVQILSQMDAKKAGKILDLMDGERRIELAVKLE